MLLPATTPPRPFSFTLSALLCTEGTVKLFGLKASTMCDVWNSLCLASCVRSKAPLHVTWEKHELLDSTTICKLSDYPTLTKHCYFWAISGCFFLVYSSILCYISLLCAITHMMRQYGFSWKIKIKGHWWYDPMLVSDPLTVPTVINRVELTAGSWYLYVFHLQANCRIPGLTKHAVYGALHHIKGHFMCHKMQCYNWKKTVVWCSLWLWRSSLILMLKISTC